MFGTSGLKLFCKVFFYFCLNIQFQNECSADLAEISVGYEVIHTCYSGLKPVRRSMIPLFKFVNAVG